MKNSTSTARRLSTKIGTAVAITAAAAVVSLAGAGSASASTTASQLLAPGEGVCVAAQYGSYQVRFEGSATGQGAKFKLLRNGGVILNTPNRVPSWSPELRTAYGTFPGPGYYSACAQNTGTANTIVHLVLRTDSEF